MNTVIRSETRKEADYLTFKEVAARLRFSTDTLRRHMINGKLDGVEWVDFFNNGKLRATRKSVDEFERVRLEATGKIYRQSIQNSRPS